MADSCLSKNQFPGIRNAPRSPRPFRKGALGCRARVIPGSIAHSGHIDIYIYIHTYLDIYIYRFLHIYIYTYYIE